MSLYDLVRDLPLEIESYQLEGLELQASFLRKTTIVKLSGAGEQGSGEDVTYDAAEHDALQARGPDLPLAGSWTLDGFSRHLADLPLFTGEPDQHAYLDYRRWAFESAALDLALRQAGTSLGDGARIGNFVETKAATLEAGVKVNHLSYIGDATVGANSNIGAGTITCNYDGFKKHKTIIGQGAFVGTNSSLVAPVKIGNGAYIGSGSVITKDVPDDAMAVERSPQSNREGGAAKYREMKLRANKAKEG